MGHPGRHAAALLQRQGRRCQKTLIQLHLGLLLPGNGNNWQCHLLQQRGQRHQDRHADKVKSRVDQSNPEMSLLAGAFLTALIQSSSASVGILQALSMTGQVPYGAAIPIIMGQNIGTCATALLSSVGANRSARRTAMVHLLFNVIGTAVWLTGFCLVRALLRPLWLEGPACLCGITVAH